VNKLSNKETFRSECFNLHIFHKDMMYENEYGLMFASTKGHAHPPVSREELKRLADFITKYLENK